MTPLGRYVTRRREQRGWSRAELARKSGVPYSTLSNIERKEQRVKPTEDTLRALARVLDDGEEGQLFTLAGYGTVASNGITERARRIDALLNIAPRWASVMDSISEMSPEEQNQALTALEIHAELVRRRRRRRD